MIDLRSIEEIAISLIEKNPDPVVEYRLFRDVLLKSPSDPIITRSRQQMLHSAGVRELAEAQLRDGSWGRFHSEDTKRERGSKPSFKTSEIAIERGLALGLEAHDPVFVKAIEYMTQVLTGEAQWSDCEEKNDRWPSLVRLVTAGTLAIIEPDNPMVISEWNFWYKVAQSSFASGIYSPEAERQAYRELLGIDVPNSRIITKYALNILAAQSKRLPVGLDERIVSWVWENNHISYIGTSLYNPKTQHLNSWFAAMELLTGFQSWRKYAIDAIEWLVAQRNANGLWDFPLANKTDYFPLSTNWRKKGVREIDYSLRVLVILRKFINDTKVH